MGVTTQLPSSNRQLEIGNKKEKRPVILANGGAKHQG
jgi:hypothetical protein